MSILSDLCERLPNSSSCMKFIENYADIIQEFHLSGANPDDICISTGICEIDEWSLFPKSEFKLTASLHLKSSLMSRAIQRDFLDLANEVIAVLQSMNNEVELKQ